MAAQLKKEHFTTKQS